MPQGFLGTARGDFQGSNPRGIKKQHRQSRCCFLGTRWGHLSPKSRRKRRLGLEIWHLWMPISPLRGSRPRSIKIRTQRMLCALVKKK